MLNKFPVSYNAIHNIMWYTKKSCLSFMQTILNFDLRKDFIDGTSFNNPDGWTNNIPSF